MLMPSIFGENFMDDFFGFPERYFGRNFSTNRMMQTDVAETDDGYEVTMDLPGFKKEDVKAELKNGYLTITANTNTNNDEKDKNGKYIRRERYSGTCSRSFYVGENVTQEDIKARFENGTLKLDIPKKEKPKVEESKWISIEG
ncbi:MAG: Hsp20/alpha crystallin family protein [Ruminococcus sp.]|jgi:HSP20 family molecular chaperone IbpA|nr:Hsp20/alpha crystallin family protein [Ruminococcus sp.]